MWSMKTISSKTTRVRKSKMKLWRWSKQMERGRSDKDKYKTLNSLTYDQFTDAKANKQHITMQTLQMLGMVTTFQFTSPHFLFKASGGWIHNFKKEHKMRGM
jgi:hypothetical protein